MTNWTKSLNFGHTRNESVTTPEERDRNQSCKRGKGLLTTAHCWESNDGI